MYILGGPAHPVIVAIRDNEDYIWVLLCSDYTTVTGWGVGGPPEVYRIFFVCPKLEDPIFSAYNFLAVEINGRAP